MEDDLSLVQVNASDGVVGLNNLGNTCYMNAALQCLGNLECVRHYLLGMHFYSEINTSNILGSKGEIVTALAKLWYNKWNKSCSYGHVNPSHFKKIFCEHSPMYQGYEQHDSAEFLAQLLDYVHEDVNRVREKKYVEMPDLQGTEE